MKNRMVFVVMMIAVLVGAAGAQKAVIIDNPAIDPVGFRKLVNKALDHREKRRLTEDQFIAMSKEDGVVILDARSKEKFDELHIKGAVNLSFPDITVDSLATLFPDKNTKILIYCNNNFENAERAFPTKVAQASLNLSTYISLLDANTTKIELVPTEKEIKSGASLAR